MQAISERENRAAFLRSLSLRRKGHPSGGIHAPWYLPSEIAGAWDRLLNGLALGLSKGTVFDFSSLSLLRLSFQDFPLPSFDLQAGLSLHFPSPLLLSTPGVPRSRPNFLSV